MNPILVSGLAAPAVVAIAALAMWVIDDAGAALAVITVGWGAVLAFHLWNLQRLARWAADALETPVPEGRGPWRTPFTALYRRSRTRTAYQRDLTQTIERFRSAAEAVPDGMVVLDATNRIRWANRRAQTHLGLDLAHDTGRPLANLVRQPEFIRYLDALDHSEAVAIASQREPGTTLSIQIVPFGTEEKLLISRDVTRLQEVARMRRDFIANVSHELKTPLTVVTGFLETLQDLHLAPQQQARYLDLMQQQARSMQRLVDDLLTLSALESEAGEGPDTPFPITPLLSQLAADARALSGGAHTVTLDPGPPAEVRGSRDELASAFGNLVSNAIRYTQPGGTIALQWQVEDDGTGVFSVTDSGIGIAPEHIPRLTERFYRVDRSRSRATGGTGLGLAIVKHVLLRHDAQLLISSEPGHGSRFDARLPAARVMPSETPADISDPSRADNSAAGH